MFEATGEGPRRKSHSNISKPSYIPLCTFVIDLAWRACNDQVAIKYGTNKNERLIVKRELKEYDFSPEAWPVVARAATRSHVLQSLEQRTLQLIIV